MSDATKAYLASLPKKKNPTLRGMNPLLFAAAFESLDSFGDVVATVQAEIDEANDWPDPWRRFLNSRGWPRHRNKSETGVPEWSIMRFCPRDVESLCRQAAMAACPDRVADVVCLTPSITNGFRGAYYRRRSVFDTATLVAILRVHGMKSTKYLTGASGAWVESYRLPPPFKPTLDRVLCPPFRSCSGHTILINTGCALCGNTIAGAVVCAKIPFQRTEDNEEPGSLLVTAHVDCWEGWPLVSGAEPITDRENVRRTRIELGLEKPSPTAAFDF